MSKTITMTETSLKEIIGMAIKMGSMNLGAKQHLLVKAVFEEAEEEAKDVIMRMPIEIDISAEGLELIKPKAGCVVPESKTMNDLPRVPGENPSCDLDEARRRQAVARATMAELDLAERQGKLVSIEEADRQVAEVREKAPCLSVDMNEVGTYTIAVFANAGVAFIRTPDAEGAQRPKSLLDKG